VERTRGDLIATEAERVIDEIRHTGTDAVDDGGFMSLLLERVAPAELAQIPKRTGGRHRSGTEFFEFFAKHPRNGWERVAKLAEARAGDIIVWKDPQNRYGHVALVAHAPKYDKEARAWTLRVHGSSSESHLEDTRRRQGRYHAGVGSGELKLRVGSKGVRRGVQAGPESDFHNASFAIARLVDQAPVEEIRPKYRAPDRAAAVGYRIERAAIPNEILQDGEFALATYALALTDGVLLPSTTLACWGPGQKISQSVGNGIAAYAFVGVVVFRNC
jgi:hypothetical protein